MELNTKGRYAVMAMADLAQESRSGATSTSLADIADRQQISLAYLEQIFMKLRRAGLVESVRGRSGGYLLARPASAIAIDEIMAAVDEPVEMTRCAAEGLAGCVGHKRCLTHGLWEGLTNHIRQYLGGISLADVLDGVGRRSREAAE